MKSLLVVLISNVSIGFMNLWILIFDAGAQRRYGSQRMTFWATHNWRVTLQLQEHLDERPETRSTSDVFSNCQPTEKNIGQIGRVWELPRNRLLP